MQEFVQNGVLSPRSASFSFSHWAHRFLAIFSKLHVIFALRKPLLAKMTKRADVGLKTLFLTNSFSLHIIAKKWCARSHCTKRRIFGPKFVRIRNDKRSVYDSILRYSVAHDATYTESILLESGPVFRIQFSYS